MIEIWKNIKGFEGYYKISNLGNVLSLNYRKTGMPKVLKPYAGKNGYPQLILSANGKKRKVYVHRLVAENFIANPFNKKIINHIDYNRLNNSVDNLEWCTYQENTDHSRERVVTATQIANNKAVIQYDRQGNKIAEYNSLSDASRKTNINCGHICQCAQQNEKSAGGYIWRYAD